jgi:hypothetical protein
LLINQLGTPAQRTRFGVMLSGALQRNAEHEARLSNISDCSLRIQQKLSEILRFAQDDSGEADIGP